MRSTQQENPTTYVIDNNNLNKLKHLSVLRRFLGTVFSVFSKKQLPRHFYFMLCSFEKRKKEFDQLSRLIKIVSIAHLLLSILQTPSDYFQKTE